MFRPAVRIEVLCIQRSGLDTAKISPYALSAATAIPSLIIRREISALSCSQGSPKPALSPLSF